MSTLLVWREQMQRFYAKYSIFIRIGFQFCMGFLVFYQINSNIGFMKTASSTACTAGLAAICAFLPAIVMVMAATALVLLHFYTLSLPVAIVAALLFLLMYIFYFRFSSGKAWLVLLTACSFAMDVPFVLPIAAGLLGTPACIVPAACGTLSYYVIHLVKGSSSTFKAGDGVEMVETLISFTKQTLMNQEMWVMIAAVAACTLLVYSIRTLSVDHAWKFASVGGAVAAVVIAATANVALNLHISLSPLVISGVIGVLAGLLLEVIFLSVDYARTEYLEFEDDEYHYHVKAVPKIGVTVPQKSVKHINERQNTGSIGGKNNRGDNGGQTSSSYGTGYPERPKSADEILLERSLNKELGLDGKSKK